MVTFGVPSDGKNLKTAVVALFDWLLKSLDFRSRFISSRNFFTTSLAEDFVTRVIVFSLNTDLLLEQTCMMRKMKKFISIFLLP